MEVGYPAQDRYTYTTQKIVNKIATSDVAKFTYSSFGGFAKMPPTKIASNTLCTWIHQNGNRILEGYAYR